MVVTRSHLKRVWEYALMYPTVAAVLGCIVWAVSNWNDWKFVREMVTPENAAQVERWGQKTDHLWHLQYPDYPEID